METIAQANLDYHIVVLTKIVKGAVRSNGTEFECGTCRVTHVIWYKVPHQDNCPVGDLQRLIDGDAPPEITERNYRLANEGLHKALDSIHELVKSDPIDPKADDTTNVAIINMVRRITMELVKDQKRRKADG